MSAEGAPLQLVGHTGAIAALTDDQVAADFAAMYEVHFPRLVRALRISGLPGPSAEDVAQEAFARTLGHWRRVRLGSNPPGYVYRTAFRLTRKQWRHEQPLADTQVAHEDVAAEAVATALFEKALADMPPRRRACAVLCFLAGLTTGEAARSLGIAEGTVRKQLGLARDDLRALVEESPLAG